MDNIVNEMQKFNFSKTEALVYTTLIKYSSLNGSQIAKLLKVSRASVYSALDNLYKRGVVFLLPDDSSSNMYRAKSPKVLFKKLKKEYAESADKLEKEFSKFGDVMPQEQYWNIKGYNNFVLKVKELLFMAEEEVYISLTNIELQQFKEEIKELQKRGVRIIVFTKDKLDVDNEFIEKFEMNIKPKDMMKKMVLVIDDKTSLIASGMIKGDFIGTFTDNPFLVEIAADYIHYKIYMIKIYKEKNLDPSVFMKLDTLQERKIKFYNKAYNEK
ncbi:MAG: TrmB family transcriptional regulator [Fusobacteriota bacterium]